MDEKKNFYKIVLTLVIPIALQNLINVAVQSADVFMLGKVGQDVLSAASLGGQVSFIMNLIFFGLTSGASVLTAQYWGKKDMAAIEKIIGIALRFSLAIAVVFTLITFLFPGHIMSLLSSEELVREHGVVYLRIICISYIFTAITMIYLNVMRSMERVIISAVVYLISLIVNIVLNAILIFGLLGIPAMGIKGAAIATVIARISEVILVLLYDKKRNDLFDFKLKLIIIKDKLLFKDFVTISGPVIINELMWGTGIAVTAAIMGQLGSEAASANAIVQVVRQLAMVVSFGIASAAAIMIGKAIGEKKPDLANIYGSRLAKLSILSGIGGAVVVLIARPVTLSIMELSPNAKEYLSVMMLMMAYYVIGQAYNTMMIVGIFRAGGDTKFGLLMDMATLWGVSVLIGALGAFVFKLSVPMVFAIILCDETLKIPFVTYRYKSKKWLNNVTR